MLQKIVRSPFVQGAVRLFRRYFSHHVGHDSAALTYYLLFSIFPLAIFLSNLVGILAVDPSEILAEITPIVPEEVRELLGQYLTYVSQESSGALLGFSLVFSIYFPMRAANALLSSVRKAYGTGPSTRFLSNLLRVLFYTLFLIFALTVSLVLLTVGDRVLYFLSRFVPLSDGFIRIWNFLRFVLFGLIAFFVIALLYSLAHERRTHPRIWPGVLLSLVVWMIGSLLFSLYVENLGRYSVLYGSIGTIIVLLLWLYLAATTLILGAEFNSVLMELHPTSALEKEELT